jgi:hypothetical protein
MHPARMAAEGTIVMNHKGFQLECLTDHVEDIFHFSFNLGSATLGNIGTVECIDAAKPVSSLMLVSQNGIQPGYLKSSLV